MIEENVLSYGEKSVNIRGKFPEKVLRCLRFWLRVWISASFKRDYIKY